MILASILGGTIGINRELRAKEAGIRTHFLVSALLEEIQVISHVTVKKADFSLDE